MNNSTNLSNHRPILQVALLKPFRNFFDYWLPQTAEINPQTLKPGIRVLVPFAKQELVGILVSISTNSTIAPEKIRPLIAILDEQPLISPRLFKFYQWASAYYQHPIGEVLCSTLPILLRKITPISSATYSYISTANIVDMTALQKAPKQKALLNFLQAHPQGVSLDAIKAAGFSISILRILQHKEWIKALIPKPGTIFLKPLPIIKKTLHSPLTLNPEQAHAVTQVIATAGFQTYLLQGVTGSGKTEVYLQIIAYYLQQNKQALVLVPEIGLTPQTIARFETRFSVPMAVLHSRLTPKERRDIWLRAQSGEIQLIIGTRSAIFTPFIQLGIIILDEEHDTSFKQNSGFRYSARDLAIARGHLLSIPVLLGTATPSLETLQNAISNRFKWLILPQRAGDNVSMPDLYLIDLRNKPLTDGLAPELIQAIKTHLNAGNQVLLFLNRRGYAPALLCQQCGWIACCLRCDAKLTLHRALSRVICHHCQAIYAIPKTCKQCIDTPLFPVGMGTERLEYGLRHRFPLTQIIRVDTDAIHSKKTMETILDEIQLGKPQILIGTQMLAKGHHFPNVTLVGIVGIDTALFSSDFRATERMGQLILQVSGRSGRCEKPGQVFLQTYQPDHPLLQLLIHKGYTTFAKSLLKERYESQWPPFTYLALLRAETKKDQIALDFLTKARDLAESFSNNHIQILGPIPASMERKAGYFRALLLLRSKNRAHLQSWLTLFLPKLETITFKKGKVRWSLDIDPLEIT